MSRNARFLSFEKQFSGVLAEDEDICKFFGIVMNSVVRIVCHTVKDSDIKFAQNSCFEEDTGARIGTGVVIRPGYILTAAHTLVAPPTVTNTVFYSHFDEETVWKAEKVYTDPVTDLVLLKRCSSVGHASYAKLADDVVIGQQAFTIGHSGGNECTFAVGQVADPRRPVFKEKLTDSDAETSTEISTVEPYLYIQSNNLHNNEQGSSGGPVFNSKGLVIGIHVSSANGYDTSVHLEQVKKFLKEAAEFDI